MDNFIIIAILVIVIGLVVFYIIRSKKRGNKCIGCPYANQCNSKCNDNCFDDKN